MRRLLLVMSVLTIFLTGCGDAPSRRLQKIVREAHYQEFVDYAYFDFEKLELVDYYQISEAKWCLTYLSGPDLSISSTWEKTGNQWENIETRIYVWNCNWAY